MNEDLKKAFGIAAKEHIEFQRAIGGLILQFANLESALYAVLRRYAGVSEDVGRAIFSGARRSKTMIAFIRAIAHNTQMEAARLADLEDLFPRINEISEMRDTIVHHVDGSEQAFEDSDPTTRYLNKHFVSRKGNEERFLIGSAHIDAMSADLLACCWRLIEHLEPSKGPFIPRYGPSGKPHAWLYKSPKQGSQAKRSKQVAQTQPRRPPPSRASQESGRGAPKDRVSKQRKNEGETP